MKKAVIIVLLIFLFPVSSFGKTYHFRPSSVYFRLDGIDYGKVDCDLKFYSATDELILNCESEDLKKDQIRDAFDDLNKKIEDIRDIFGEIKKLLEK